MTEKQSRLNEVRRFISEDFASFLAYHLLQEGNQEVDFYVKDSKIEYNNPLMLSLLSHIKPKVEEAYGKRLHETYAFYRIYYEGQELAPHTDRPACEVSVTLTLGAKSQYLWPIFVDGRAYTTGPGEGVIYKGCDQIHWREPFRKIYDSEDDIVWVQVFLHYIEAGGQFDPEHRWDNKEREERQKRTQ